MTVVGIPEEAVAEGPRVIWDHVDGPLLYWSVCIHWLTWTERLKLFLQTATVDDIACERWPHLAMMRKQISATAAKRTENAALQDKVLASDPVERIVESALRSAGVDYRRDGQPGNTKGLDFYLPELHLYIEVKRFHSERVASQMARVENVIAIQGMAAAKWFASLLQPKREGEV